MSNKKIFFTSFAYLDKAQTGMNVSNGKRNVIDTYMKNIAVALVSAKQYSGESEVALITNLETDRIPTEIFQILLKNDIRIKQVPFDRFCLGEKVKWGLAFYKLCALSHLIEEGYSTYCWIDSDVVVQGNLDAIWKEAEQSVLLYDINHGLNTRNYQVFIEEVSTFMGAEILITHYGGEFFAANHDYAAEFIEKANRVYDEMQTRGIKTTKGDEFITSIAAYAMRSSVKNAGAYVHRFWTCDFRLVSTCYKNNRVVALHVPDEKQLGMLQLYEKYIKRDRELKDDTVWRCLGLKHPHYIRKIKSWLVKISKNLGA